MSRYDDNRRDSARPRGTARRSAGTSLSDLHQVSPEMRERYGVSGNAQAGRRADRYAEDWRAPSVDPIGGRNLRGTRGAGQGGRGGRGNRSSGRPSFSPLFLALVALVVVLLVAVIVLAMNRCSEGSADTSNQATQTEQTSGAAESTASGSDTGSGSGGGSGAATSSSTKNTTIEAEVDRAALVKILDEDVADKLMNRAITSEDAKWIAQNPDKFAMDGIEVQQKLLKLAADEPAAQAFVRNFPEKYPMKTPQSGQVKTVATGRNIPRFYQWDELWGYTVYSGTAFGLTGCCPTCLAMVYQGITGNTDLSPYDMGELAVRDDYATEYEGTYASFLVDEAQLLDLPVSEIDVTKKALKNALQSNQAVIANFGPGLFTQYGHYVVLTGMTQDGAIIMNDPYSEERSNQTWDIDTIVEESQGFYAYG